MAKDWVQDTGTVISFTSQASSGTNMAAPATNMYDGDFDTYGRDYNSHQGFVPHWVLMVATFTQAVSLTQIKWKCYSTSNAYGDWNIWIYNGSWVNVYTYGTGIDWAGGVTGEALIVNGSWSNVTKVEWRKYGYGVDPVAWSITQDFYEAQAFGPWQEKTACII